MNPSAIFPNIKAFLARYSLQQKLSMVAAAGLVIILTWSLVYFVNRVSFQVLYSDVDPAEAQSIVTKLDSMQTPHELSDGGRTISVPSDKVAEVRIQLASEGLPESGRVGFEIFDRTNFGITNFQEQVNYQRALEGELARSILTLSEVAAARVHLVLAKDSLYEKSEEQAKASVVLKLKSGKALSASGISGIENLVASAVKGLATDKVAIIDYRGKMLSRSEAQNSMTGQQLDMQQSIESEMSAKILKILEPAVGAGKVKPQVSVALNFQQVDETQENYDPNSAVVVSSQRQSEPGGTSAQVGGIVGVNKTPAPAPAPTVAATATGAPVLPIPTTVSNGVKQSEVVNYEISKSIRHIVNPVGKIERLSVAVVLDNQTESQTGADGKVTVKSTPRTPDEMKKYSDLVAASIAYNPGRGDLLNVVNIPFENENTAESVKEPTLVEKQIPSILTALRYISIPIAFILIYFLFIRPVQKSVMAGWIPVTASGESPRGLLRGGIQTPLTVKQLEARLASGASPAEIGEMSAVEDQDMLPMPGPSRIDLIRKRVVEQAEQNPETVARLVRVWLNDEKNK
jgi:flagellar M-ring protein FliF